MAKYTVVFDDPTIADLSIERERLKGIAEVRQAKRRPMTEDALVEFSKGADAILHTWGASIGARGMDALPKLKFIACVSVGFEGVDLAAATKRGIPVCNVPDYCSNEVADHTMSLIMALERQLFALDRELKKGVWGHSIHKIIPLHSPSTQVVGLVAFGRIARRVAKRAQAFGFKVIAYDPYVPRWDFDIANVERVESLHELMSRSDVVSVHLPHNEETTRMIGAKEFAAMKRTAFFVITGRGKTVDQKALYDALKERKIAGAGLDVFDPEPMDKNDPILVLDNVIATPHVAGYTVESYRRARADAASLVADALMGKKPAFVLNPELYTKEGSARRRR